VSAAPATVVFDDDPLPELVAAWRDLFPEGSVRPRDLINRALEDTRLLNALEAALPGLTEHPQPQRLTRYLYRVENLPVTVRGERYRVVRTGYRWAVVRLLPFAI